LSDSSYFTAELGDITIPVHSGVEGGQQVQFSAAELEQILTESDFGAHYI